MKISVEKTEAAILVEQRQPLVVEEIALPETLDVGQVLVEIAFSGICGSQLGEIDGVKGVDKYLPHLLGHEGSGKVLGVGPGVSSVSVGDHVVLHWRPGDGIQSKTPTYEWQAKPLNAGFVTTFNRHAVVSENRVTRISKDYPLDLAALFGCAVTTGNTSAACGNDDLHLRVGNPAGYCGPDAVDVIRIDLFVGECVARACQAITQQRAGGVGFFGACIGYGEYRNA